nr:thiamine diphosphokinase [Lysinibacillus timonensis]
MTTVIVCSGGPENELPYLKMYQSLEEVYFIGADKGSLYLLNQGITPDEVVGDFDSLTEDEWIKITKTVSKINKVKAEKDDTDTDIALSSALLYKPTNIILTGVTGGRLDHYEAAIRSVYRIQKENLHIQMKIVDAKNEISFLFPGKHKLNQNGNYRYLSFFAYEQNVVDVTLRGVKYETTNQIIQIGTSRFTSNEMNSHDGYISFSSGICLMIRSSD